MAENINQLKSNKDLQQEQQFEQETKDLTQSIIDISSRELDQDKAQAMPILAKWVLQNELFRKEFTAEKLNTKVYKKWIDKNILLDGNKNPMIKWTVLQEVFSQMNTKQATRFAEIIQNPNDPNYPKVLAFCKSETNKFLKTAEDQKSEVWKLNVDNDNIDWLKARTDKLKTLESKAITDNNLEKIDKESLATAESQKKFATEKLGYTANERTDIQARLQNSDYAKAGLDQSQILSLLYTQKQLDQKGIVSKEFSQNMEKFHNNLKIPRVLVMQTARVETASFNSAMTYTPPTKVNKLSNVSDASLVQMSSKTASGATSPNSPANYAGITSEKLAPDYYQKLPTETIHPEPNSPKGQIRETMTTMSSSQNIKNELAILNNPNGLSSEISKKLSDQQKTITEAMKSFP